MIKKTIVIASTIMTAFIINACTMPSSLIVKGKPKVSAPVKVNTGDFNDLLMDTLKEAFNSGEEGGEEERKINILDYTSFYTGTGKDKKNIQAFLLHMPIIEKDLNLNEHFSKFEEFEGSLDNMVSPDVLDEINEGFSIGDLSSINGSFAESTIPMQLGGVFDTVTKEINDKFTGQALTVDVPITGSSLDTAPPTFGKDISLTVLDTVTFGEGELSAIVRIKPAPGFDLNGVDISFKNLKIDDSEHPAIPGLDSDTNSPDIQLTEIYPEKTVIFDLTDQTLNSDFTITIEYKEDKSTGNPLPPYPFKTVILEVIPVGLNYIKYRGITNANISDTTIPIENPMTIPMELEDDSFVHAVIKTGRLEFEIIVPDDPNIVGASWVTGLDNTSIRPDLRVIQGHSAADPDGTIWPGLNKSNSVVPDTPEPWEYKDEEDNLAGKHINTNEIEVQKDGYIIVDEALISFWLNDDDMDTGSIEITIQPKLNIQSFEVVHVNIGDEINDKIPAIDPFPLGEDTEIIKEIEFNEVGVNITFGQVDIPGMEIRISIPELGVNAGSTPIYHDIVSNGNIVFLNNTPGNKLILKDDDNNTVTENLSISFDIRPKGNKKVLAIPNLNIAEGDIVLKFEIEKIEPIFGWKHAILDLSSVMGDFGGTYPPIEKDPLDLSGFTQYLKGFKFSGLDAQLYLRGPSLMFEFTPDMEAVVEYTNSNGETGIEELLPDNFTMKSSAKFDLDPLNTGTYSGNLPSGGIHVNKFAAILEKGMEKIRVNYDIKMSEVKITPKMLEYEDNDNPVEADILVMIPMLLTAGPDGAQVILPSLFNEGQTDILDRDKAEEPFSIDFIKKLKMKVSLTENLFTGGEIYLDDTNINPDGRRIPFALGGKSLNLEFKKDDLDYINRTIPYLPDIGIHFNKGEQLQLVRNLGIAKIEFEADIEYKIENLDELFKGSQNSLPDDQQDSGVTDSGVTK